MTRIFFFTIAFWSFIGLNPSFAAEAKKPCFLPVYRLVSRLNTWDAWKAAILPYRTEKGVAIGQEKVFDSSLATNLWERAARMEIYLRAITSPRSLTGHRLIVSSRAERNLLLNILWRSAIQQYKQDRDPLPTIENPPPFLFDPMTAEKWFVQATGVSKKANELTYEDLLQILLKDGMEFQRAISRIPHGAWSTIWHRVASDGSKVTIGFVAGVGAAAVFLIANSVTSPAELTASRAETQAYRALGNQILPYDPRAGQPENVEERKDQLIDTFIGVKGNLPKPARDTLDSIFYFNGTLAMIQSRLREARLDGDVAEIKRLLRALEEWSELRTDLTNSPDGKTLREGIENTFRDYADYR